MEKNLFKSLLVGMLTCCLTVVIATSCAKDEMPVPHNEETAEQLLGDWLYFNTDVDDEEMVGKSVSYSLLRFDEKGVITRTIYSGYEGTPLKYWERWLRHGIYTIDEAAHTIKIEGIDNRSQVSGFTLADGQLILELRSNDGNTQTAVLRRPQADDREFLELIDQVVPSDDYIGKWVRTETVNGQPTYVLADYQEQVDIVVNRYTVTSDNKVYKRSGLVNYKDGSWDEEDGFLMIYENGIYEEGIKHWWKVEGSSLSIGYENSEEPRYTYHQLTKEEYDMFQAFDKTAIVENNP